MPVGISSRAGAAGVLCWTSFTYPAIACLGAGGPRSMMALPHVQRITHFNNWVVGHAHIGVLGFAGVTALGGLYFILPRITGKPLYSRFLADVQYWLVLIGVTGFAVVLTTVGLIQGNAWYNGETLYRTLPEIQPYYILRASLGTFIMIGAYLGLYNVVRSLYFNRGATT